MKRGQNVIRGQLKKNDKKQNRLFRYLNWCVGRIEEKDGVAFVHEEGSGEEDEDYEEGEETESETSEEEEEESDDGDYEVPAPEG